MIVEPLSPAEHALPGELLTELTALYASNSEFFALSGDFPDPDRITPDQLATALADELARPGAGALLARSAGRLVAFALTLDTHPEPADDPDPWIGLLLVHGREQRAGYGRHLATWTENHYRATGRTGLRLAVLDNNPAALAFWTALDYRVLGHRADRAHGRPCTVLRKEL
ncbi:GNAT family N-acetyltransferase [Streptomyces sp. NA04227]|uniref:GNAT family N-acetyltransferase n=1 Tax=Streptomyces sp. NA04227 TaxID=2742136 RepID=UPI001591534A|nr:GNAT family N-acetyltransferase [Streptomyces sp. NA04227]QKW08274.1 GNAT family N-acetyltransferase [Streptomyces sp. NA04227]